MDYGAIAEITVSELAQQLAENTGETQFVDVREPQELALAAIPGFVNLPLSEYEQWSKDIFNRLDREKDTLVLCHHGMRSAQMCQWLLSQGFTQVKNIVGGIDAYSTRVDSSIPRY
jgi:rhodanese-related sulfurtransferase